MYCDFCLRPSLPSSLHILRGSPRAENTCKTLKLNQGEAHSLPLFLIAPFGIKSIVIFSVLKGIAPASLPPELVSNIAKHKLNPDWLLRLLFFIFALFSYLLIQNIFQSGFLPLVIFQSFCTLLIDKASHMVEDDPIVKDCPLGSLR